MTPEELRAVVGQIVDAAARQREQGDRSYARGLMDAADRLRRYLPPEAAKPTPAPSKPEKAATAPPSPGFDPLGAAIEAPAKKTRKSKPKGV